MNRWWILSAAVLLLPSAAYGGSYRVVEPGGGKMLVGHAGVQAVDDRTATALVRVISPGNAVDQRGTIRVLVQNLSSKPFEFGPEQVKLTLGDGTVLAPSSVDAYEKGRVLVEREVRSVPRRRISAPATTFRDWSNNRAAMLRSPPQAS